MSIFNELWYTERYTADTMNLDRFQNRYFEMKRIDAAQRRYDAAKYNKYEGETRQTQQPYRAEARSNIRERVILGQLARLDDPRFATALESRQPTLSPDYEDRRSGAMALRVGAKSRLLRQLEMVRAQDAAADADERAFAKMSPLQQSRTRDGFYRKGVLDRNAAIAGYLQRERRQSAPLTREAVGRAKSIDAARGMTDPYVVSDSDLELAAAGPLTSLAYENYLLTEKRRRETFFAQRMIVSGGYPGRRQMKAKSIQKVSCGSA